MVAVAGVAAGGVNAVVGSGTLITFPVLLAVGYPPLLANVSNTVGLTPGGASGALGYRAELTGQRGRLALLGTASVTGGLTGGLLLLVLPSSAFEVIVPVLVAASVALVALRPWLARRRARPEGAFPEGRSRLALLSGTFGAGVYGGYFGAAQGVLLIGLLGAFLADDLQRINAMKNVLAGLVNGTAAVLFVLVADIAWEAAAPIALGSVLGGQLGARAGRRLPPAVLRGAVMAGGVVALAAMVVD